MLLSLYGAVAWHGVHRAAQEVGLALHKETGLALCRVHRVVKRHMHSAQGPERIRLTPCTVPAGNVNSPGYTIGLMQSAQGQEETPSALCRGHKAMSILQGCLWGGFLGPKCRLTFLGLCTNRNFYCSTRHNTPVTSSGGNLV